MRPSNRCKATLYRNPPRPRLSPAPKPVTQINRLTRASCIAVMRILVALEKSRVGLSDFGSGRYAKRLGDDIDAGQGTLHRSHLERVTSHFFELGVIQRYSSGRPRQRTN